VDEAVFHRQDVGHEFVAYLYRRTEGNPLLTVLMLRAVIDAGRDALHRRAVGVGALGGAAAARRPWWTSSSGDSAASRSRRGACSPGAAVLGREFEIELAMDAGVATEAELLAAVEEGYRAAVVVTAPGGGEGDRYAFAHGLFAELLVEGMVPRRRRAAHERAAQALLRRAPGAAAEIAWHFDEAADAPNAYRYALQAGAQARVVHAHDEAERFLQIAERHAGTPAELAEVRARRGELAEATGRYGEAETLLDLAAGWFTGHGDRARALPLRRRPRAGARDARAPRARDDRPRARAARRGRAARARPRAGGDPRPAREAHARLGEHDAAEREAWAAVHATSTLGDATLPGRRARPARGDGVARPPRAGDRDPPAGAHPVRRHRRHPRPGGGARAPRDRAAAARAVARRAGRDRPRDRRGGPRRAPDLRGYLALCLGTVQMRRGEYDRARELFGDAMQLFAAVRSGDLQLDALLSLAFLDLERGEPASARSSTRRRWRSRGGSERGGRGGGTRRRRARAARARPAGRGRAASAAADALALSRTEWFLGRELADALAVRRPRCAGSSSRPGADSRRRPRRPRGATATARRGSPRSAPAPCSRTPATGCAGRWSATSSRSATSARARRPSGTRSWWRRRVAGPRGARATAP
jgi:tetratricopeptide (TPR) repeat protein